jgi:PAS domain S-box-containing protein
VIELSRYVLEALRRDEEFILYRGRRQDDVCQILVLSPVADHPTPESLRRLEHECSFKEALDPAWSARPIAVARHSDRAVLELQDPGGMPLDQLLSSPLDLASFLRLAISLCSAIDHLHARGIIHKDIKPANILADLVTGQCWLRGFGIASRLPRERQSAEPPEFLAGTLAYMAPEQTGRMNRCIDCRSDLYALGVTLYEMLTGSLPFTASDPMEWVHCHIARKPIPPSERFEKIPAPVSAIIMKLLAKTAEERYQTASGAESDLRRCLAAWQRSSAGSLRLATTRPDSPEVQRTVYDHGDMSAVVPLRGNKEAAWPYQMQEFALGEHDIPDRLLIPETLYGRAREIGILLASFDRVVVGGVPELVLVSGYSGIGKSSVVNELQKVLVLPRGLFASGKFDQYKRDIPYATLAQAFQGLIRPLLSKSEAELHHWRRAFREALGPNGRLMVDLVPELKLIIGEQPPLPVLPPQEAQGRFQLVFRRFIGVFARPEHPLALFLDDLQWLDAATLDLIEHLLTSGFANQQRASQADVRHLLLIGAYRDNEVDATHPLMRKLEAIRRAGAHVLEITLAPLAKQDLETLIADSLHCAPETATPLALLVHEKTGGNPFFAIQFISALAEEGLLTFDRGSTQWSWDLERIHAKGYTDNIVDLMIGKLNRLPTETQKTLKEFACLGNKAEISTLSIVHGTSEKELESELWAALRLGFIVRLDGSYQFVHDRVQEAAYSLISDELRAQAHLQIGRLLTARTPPERLEEAIFEIVNQLNRGAMLITSQDEREQLADLNLMAGKRAKASTAYTSALKYLVAGAALLRNDSWTRRHELTFALELYRAECEFLTGELVAAEERLSRLSSRTANTLELATVTCLSVDLYTTLDKSERAVAVCLDYLRHLGVEWSPHPTAEEARREYERIWIKLGSRAIEELIELPLMTDPVSLATLDVLTRVLPPALHTADANLLSMTACRAVNLGLERGHGDGSSVAYVFFGKIAGPHFGDYEAGFRFGQLGYELIEKGGLERFQARTYHWFAQFVVPWTKHVRTCRDLIRRAFEAANKIGDLTVAAYSCDNLNTNVLAAGDPLVEAQRHAENGLEFARKARFSRVGDVITAQLGLIRTLRGLTPRFGSFDEDEFEESRFERHLADSPALALPECWYWIRKLQARFFAGDYETAVNASLKAQRLLWISLSFFETAEYHFYSALVRAALSDSAAPDSRGEHVRALAEHGKQLALWAQNCPENFENRAALVNAEIARIEGRDLDAMSLYEQAVRSAHTNGFVHNEAVANELAARFYAVRGFEKIAEGYLRDARYRYLQWGATGKVRQLDELHPHLRQEEPVPGPTSTIGASVEHLDLATVIKVLQTVSSEIVLEKLIDTLMRTAIEHAGAERGLLLLPRGVEQRIEAEAMTSADTIVVRLRAAFLAEAELPESIIHYVVRTQESVILDDAATHNPFSDDTYLSRHHARSILCLPLINQGKLIGVLYLENNLTAHVFTARRIAVLKLLASQAAISLENTRLYRDLEKREAKIRRLVDANIMGIFLWNFEGQILEANEAFLYMVNHSREDLIAGRLSWKELTPPEWRDINERAVVQLKATGILQPYEKEYFRKDGSRVPVLVGSALFEKGQDEGVAFVLDLTEQKRAEEALRRSQAYLAEAQAELAHVARVTALGELTASIAHEISQPLAAVVTNANASLRWLAGDSPNLAEAREAIGRVARDGKRAGDVISRMRSLFKKASTAKERLDLNGVIEEAVILAQSEVQRNRVSLQTQLASDLPVVTGDRIQLEQVILNLLINSVEAMSAAGDGPRELSVSSQKVIETRNEEKFGYKALDDGEWTHVLITVRDSGPGLDPNNIGRLFDAFYTTKPQGLGMGLAISRSIVEAHGGWLTATADPSRGAIFQFALPIRHEDNS